eukprot:g69235.t1
MGAKCNTKSVYSDSVRRDLPDVVFVGHHHHHVHDGVGALEALPCEWHKDIDKERSTKSAKKKDISEGMNTEAEKGKTVYHKLVLKKGLASVLQGSE